MRSEIVARVPLLAELLSQDDGPSRQVWLDLGPAQAGLIRHLQVRRTRLLVAELADDVGGEDPDWNVLESGLPDRFWNEPIDRILCWDLLNYMGTEELARFSARMQRSAAPNCRIHALLRYSERDMPAEPARYRLQGDMELKIDENRQNRVPAPRYSPKGLEKAMPGLRVERTMLLNNGMQEYLFALAHEVK